MAWKDIIGQDRIKKLLQNSIRKDKIPSAWLFYGIDGIGKDALALEFAKTVNCSNPNSSNSVIEACGNCSSCKVFNTLSHPNLQMIYSLPAGKTADNRNETATAKLSDEQIQAIQEQLQLKAENYYHKLSIQNATQIRISSIRDVKKNLSLSANMSGRRVVIIFKADEMTSEASNAFLKTLEEPSSNVTLILISSKPQLLPITILSRCQQIGCEPLSDEQIAKALVERHELDKAEAKLVASFAHGSYSSALQYLDDDMRQLRKDVVELLRTSLKKTTYRVELMSNIEKLTSAKDKIKLETSLSLLLMWLRDAMALTTGDKVKLLNNDQTVVLKRFSARYANCDLFKAIKATEKTTTYLKRNVNPQLAMINLFLDLRKIFLN